MNKALSSFALVAVFAALLMALSLTVARHGYPYGVIGMKRLDSIANAATFMPIAAIYFFSAMLMMVLPIKVASVILINVADAAFWTVVFLFAVIVGSLGAKWAFGLSSAPWTLLNWHFLFVAAVVGCHLLMNALRRNILLRSLFFVVFAVATLASLFWSFTV